MNKTMLSLALALACTASSVFAHEDLELDEFRNGDEAHERWSGNSNVSDQGGCYIVPGRFNVARGDAVLSSDPEGVIYKLLSSLGQRFSHSGMAMSDTSIRHNTADQNAFDTNDSFFIPQSLQSEGDSSLRNAWPGVITQTAEATATFREFIMQDGVVLYSTRMESGVRQAAREAAASTIEQMQGWYRWFSYTDVSWRDPFHVNNDDGNMCAGTIFHAHRLVENQGWTFDAVRHYPAEIRQPAAELMYEQIRVKVREAPDWIGHLGFSISELFGATSLNTFARRAANQFVNCMAFDDCGNTGTRWRNGVGPGSSLSPEDLYNLTYLYAMFEAWGNGEDYNFVYDSVKPLEATGSYYCCNVGDDDSPRRVACDFRE